MEEKYHNFLRFFFFKIQIKFHLHIYFRNNNSRKLIFGMEPVFKPNKRFMEENINNS